MTTIPASPPSRGWQPLQRGKAPPHPAPPATSPGTDRLAVTRSAFDLGAIPGAALPDVLPARRWTPGAQGMSGVDANAIINDTYHRQDAAMTAYLVGPPLANFMSLAKYGSREAGSQIRDLEATMAITHTLTTCDGSIGNDVRALKALAGTLMAEGNVARGVTTMVAAARSGWSAWRQGRQAETLNGQVAEGAARAIAATQTMTAAPALLRHALVEGNTAIYHDIGRSFQLFLAAEKAGKDGVLTLRSAIRAGYVADPLGYLEQSFTLYRAARIAGLAAQRPETPVARRQVLLAERQAHILRANLLLATQEQAFPVETPTTWRHPKIAAIMGALSKDMTLTIGGEERVKLLAQGGNWADYQTRMGFVDVTQSPYRPAGAIRVTMPWAPGVVKFYLPDPTQKGTISALFIDNFSGTAGDRQRLNAPRPIRKAFAD